MKTIDLHVHSNISDGTLTPSEVVDLAVKQNLSAFALTDHDTIKGIDEALRRAEEYQKNGTDITVLPGVEFSVGYKKRDIHILGLLIDHKNPKLVHILDQLVLEREQRNQKMIKNFQDAGYDITLEELKADSKDAVITRAHFAKLLLKKNYVKSMKEAFDKYLGEDGPFYVNRKFITPEEAIDYILEANGIPVLAHPLLYNLAPSELDSLIERLKSHGLMALEAIYSTYTKKDQDVVRYLASKHHLAITGGSDFHGSNKPDIMLGTGINNLSIPHTLLDTLKSLKPNI